MTQSRFKLLVMMGVLVLPTPHIYANATASGTTNSISNGATHMHVNAQMPMLYANFDAWRNDFIARVGYDNISYIYPKLMQARHNQRVIDLDNTQAEFSKMPWEYLQSATAASRVNEGKNNLNKQRALLNQNAARYGVPAEIVTAIWGLESSYGAGFGHMDLVESLANLAFDGRRRTFAEQQLLAINAMMMQGLNVDFKGSWAGGMGHTQFIPTTWLNFGIDGDGDGQKNPWHKADALSATANYLSQSGWITGLPAHIEVRLPPSFNSAYAQSALSLDAWQQLGLQSLDKQALMGGAIAKLWLPAGVHGPAFLTTQNFEVIKVYNNSANYALAVSLLAQKIDGKAGIMASWPVHERPLSRTQIKALQQKLTQMGYDTKGVDGIAGHNTRQAFAKWQYDHGVFADGFISQNSAKPLL